MLKFKTSCAVLAYLSSNLLNEVGLSFFRYFEVGLRVCDIIVKKITFAISSPDEFLFYYGFSLFDLQCNLYFLVVIVMGKKGALPEQHSNNMVTEHSLW